MIPLSRLASLALAPLALAACGSNSDTGGQAASSKILEGSISDNMIPYEKLRSEAPLSRIEAGEGEGTGDDRTGPGTDGGSPETSTSQEAPAATIEPPVPSPPND